MKGTAKLETQKRWQKLFGKQIILQGAVEPDSIRKTEQGIGALLAAEYPLHGKVRIFVKTDPKNADLTMRKLRSGRIGLTGVLKEPVFLRNPGTYDGYLFNKIKGIHGNLTVSPAQLQELGEPLPLRFRFTALAQKVRENALVQLHISAGAILPGMVLGGYQGVGPEEADVFRDNGIAHLLAVSGTHVAVLAMILQALVRPAGKKGIIFIQLFLALYALLCGLQPAVLRAVVMACVLLWGRSRKLKADSLRLLLLTGWVLLLANGRIESDRIYSSESSGLVADSVGRDTDGPDFFFSVFRVLFSPGLPDRAGQQSGFASRAGTGGSFIFAWTLLIIFGIRRMHALWVFLLFCR